jgi:formate/nitrite transporter FocA (FNT family)
MEKQKKKNKWLSFFVDGVLSGLMIGIGGIVNMSCDNRYMGAFLFSLGLFCIVHLQYGLYTGKVGYILDRDKAYLGETFFTLLANAVGASLTAVLIRLTRFATATVTGLEVTLTERAQSAMTAKLEDNLLSSFILAFFCGIMMFSAVEGNRRCTEKKDTIASLFVVVMPILVFILSGFNHCVADVFTYVLAGCPSPEKAILYFPVAILGNLVGGITIPFLKRFSRNPLR